MIIACCELAPVIGEFGHNQALATAAIQSAAESGADVVVLPELVLSGYCFSSTEEARSLAVSLDWDGFGRWAELAPDAVIVAGFAELADDGTLYNSAIMLHGGQRVCYRKVHLWDREKLFFTPGARPAPVVETAHGRIAMMVCYDLEFPEYTRSVGLRGAQLLTVPTNWPYAERPEGWPAPEVMLGMAAARVNRMVVAACDRRGIERGQAWNEGSTIIGPDGWPVATAGADGWCRAEIDLAGTPDKAISERNDLFADRRPELY